MIVVSDASPVEYLVVIDAAHVLPAMYERVIVPTEVLRELQHDGTPPKVREWIASAPAWFEVQSAPAHARAEHLHAGETAAIALARELRADLLLMDDADGRRYANGQGLATVGTLGVIRDAARSNLLDIRAAIAGLRETNFRATEELYEQIIDEYERRR